MRKRGGKGSQADGGGLGESRVARPVCMKRKRRERERVGGVGCIDCESVDDFGRKPATD